MMEHGAKSFAFMSRSGLDNPEAAHTVQRLRDAGATCVVFRADASDEETVQRVVSDLQAVQPIRGVIHAAMVLSDGMLATMDSPSFNKAVVPKVKGAIALHKALGTLDLDFFIMTSSISAVLGNIGQSNYSAANSFLDAMAKHRNQQGLAGVSLVLLMVLDVGVVAENDAIESSLMRKGLYGIDEAEMLRGFEAAMHQHGPLASSSSQILMGMDSHDLAESIRSAGGVDRADVYWYSDARFCHVRTAIENDFSSTALGGRNAEETFMVALQSAPDASAALETIARHIFKRVAVILMIPEDNFEPEGRSVASYGLDSMIGTEMRTWLFKEFTLDIPFQELLAPTLTMLELAARSAQALGVDLDSS